jgi:NhaP-type Na+/H+ or K+/H+ antiporter
MRGVVSLAAALSLPHDFPGRDVVLFATFGVIAATVLVQGSTLGLLIRWFIKPAAVSEQTSMLNESATRAHWLLRHSAPWRRLPATAASPGIRNSSRNAATAFASRPGFETMDTNSWSGDRNTSWQRSRPLPPAGPPW